MSRFLVLAGLVVSGCFYTDPINQRPSIDIHQISPDIVYRNTEVNLEAVSSDPDGDAVAYQWRAYACTEEGDCDKAPFYTGIQKLAHFKVPMNRTEATTPLKLLSVTLEGKDDFGATARPVQHLAIALNDKAPDLELRKEPRHAYVVDTDIKLYAKVGDVDDTAAKVAPLDWIVYSPATQPAYEIIDLTVMQDPDDPDHLQSGKLFTPHGTGDWDIQVTATDPVLAPTVQHLPITVVPDHVPCLGQWSPTASADPAQTIPLSDPTLFQVLVVEDDLDPFPVVPDGLIKQTEFHWSIVPPGGSRIQLTNVTGSGVALDPASYVPGDLVELRVQIEDRKHVTPGCADTSFTCSVISDATCGQRLVWKVLIQ